MPSLLGLLAALLAAPAARGECERFIVIAMQRSGSRYFVHQLSTHPEIVSDGELFVGWGGEGGRGYADFGPMKKEIEQSFDRHCAIAGTKFAGFKWMTNQGHDERRHAIKKYMLNRGVKLVYLWRRNVLRQLISNLANRRTVGLAHPESREDAAKADVDLELPAGGDLIHALKKIERQRRRVRSYYHPEVKETAVFYEDLIAGSPRYNDSWARVVKFLGAAPHAFEPSAADTVIIHQSRPTLASVRNADEVRATLEAACRNQRDREAHAHVAADILVVCDELQREYGAFPEKPPAAGYVAT